MSCFQCYTLYRMCFIDKVSNLTSSKHEHDDYQKNELEFNDCNSLLENMLGKIQRSTIKSFYNWRASNRGD